MADLIITAANVHIHDTTTITRTVQFGETMTAGQGCYLKSSDQKYWKADATTASGAFAAKGIVMVGAVADGYGIIAESGPVDVGAALTVGVPYIVSETGGGIAPAADFSGFTSATLTHYGYAEATDRLYLKIYTTAASN